MKKLLSLTLALIMVLTSLMAAGSIYAEENATTSKLYQYTLKQMEAGSKYSLGKTTSFGAADAVRLYNLSTVMNTSGYMAHFKQSINDNMSSNGGKLISSYSNKEDLALYGASILALKNNGEEVSGLKEAFLNADFDSSKPSSPYYYEYAVNAALYCGDKTLAKKLCDDFIATNYTLGKGMQMNGFYSCDNTAHFIMALAGLKDDYSGYIADAKAVIQKYTRKDGAVCDLPSDDGTAMSPDVNADSTGLALAAYSVLGEYDTAFKYYKNLVEGFESKTGIFQFGGYDNVMATNDALIGISAFSALVKKEGKEHSEHIVKTYTTPATTEKEGSIITKCVIDGVVVSKKVIPKKQTAAAKVTVKQAEIKKLTKGKKQIKVSWKKLSGVTGYQVQLATDKKFKKNRKTVTVKGAKKTAKTVKKLKAKKKYYVRVRAYKTVNGKKTYGKWSKVKTVKTK